MIVAAKEEEEGGGVACRLVFTFTRALASRSASEWGFHWSTLREEEGGREGGREGGGGQSIHNIYTRSITNRPTDVHISKEVISGSGFEFQSTTDNGSNRSNVIADVAAAVVVVVVVLVVVVVVVAVPEDDPESSRCRYYGNNNGDENDPYTPPDWNC